MKYFITVGLPGSGKSFWARNYKDSKDCEIGWYHKREFVKIIECDNIKKLSEHIKKNIKVSEQIEEIIIDGLFTTNEDVIRIIKCLKPTDRDKIIICQWKEDRELCKKNDLYRRDINSTITIDNLAYEDINVKKLKKEFSINNISKKEFDVYKKEIYELFIAKYKIPSYDGKTIVSDSWSIGGTSCDCWGNTYSIGSKEPCEFIEFDELLEKICPDISFLQYKKIRQECVRIEEESYGDYYGGAEYFNYYVCDIKCLYEILLEMNLIKMVNET